MAELTFDSCAKMKSVDTLLKMRESGRAFIPQTIGVRTRIWKQDPLLPELGIRPVYLPNRVTTGPNDGVIRCAGVDLISPDHQGDFVPATANTEAFDSVHSFSVVRMTLNMFERQIGIIPWQWNRGGGTIPISVYPHAGIDKNAYYSREEQALKFFQFFSDIVSRQVFTCRSLDIIAHETGHAVLDALKPGWIASFEPETGGLHEAFGDITSILLILSVFDLTEYVVAETKADLHQTGALSALAEEFGASIIRGTGRPPGLRNAFNSLTMSDVDNEVHNVSQVFTGAFYSILADLYTARRQPTKRDDAEVLHETGAYLGRLLIRAIKESPENNASFADVARALIEAAKAENDNTLATLVKAEFISRKVLTPAGGTGVSLAGIPVVSNGRCGTMHRYVCQLD